MNINQSLARFTVYGWATDASVCKTDNGFRKITSTLKIWYLRHRQRKDLGHLSDRLLADIGVSRREAELETQKHFWQT